LRPKGLARKDHLEITLRWLGNSLAITLQIGFESSFDWFIQAKKSPLYGRDTEGISFKLSC